MLLKTLSWSSCQVKTYEKKATNKNKENKTNIKPTIFLIRPSKIVETTNCAFCFTEFFFADFDDVDFFEETLFAITYKPTLNC